MLNSMDAFMLITLDIFISLNKLIDEFTEWYKSTSLNPIEKAALAHYNLYRIHPFLDGNK